MLDEPTMSDQTLLLSVEDLINLAMGPVAGNTVDFKMVKTILHILARQMRLLEQKVIMEVGELPPAPAALYPLKSGETSQSSMSDSKGKGKGKQKVGDKKEGQVSTDARRPGRIYESESEESEDSDAREESEEEAQRAKDKERRLRVKAQRDKERAEMERAKMEKMNPKEREEYQKELEIERQQREEAEKLAEEEEERAEKEAKAKREKARAENKKEKAEKERLRIEKEKERDEKERAKMAKMSPSERKQYEKELEQEKIKLEKARIEQEKIEKEKARAQREKEKEKERADREKAKMEKMSPREREKYEKELKKDNTERENERKRLEKMSPKEREQYEKDQYKEREREKLEKMGPKERENYEKEKQKEKAEKEKAKKEKMSPQEREQYEKEQQKEKEKAEKERAKIEKMSPKEKEQYEKEKKIEKAEKDRAKLEKMGPKEKEQYEKEQQKEKAEKDKATLEKMSPKEKEQYEKERQKEKEKAEKDKAKLEKMSPKEKEQYEKELQKEKEKEKAKLEKMSPQERKKYEQEKERKPGETGESISEKYDTKLKGKVLVVEKGPSKRGGELDRRRSSIEVVTRSQFALLESAVEALKKHTGPLPALKLPGNEQLRSDLAKGNLSLPDAMTAMQVSARVQAAEQAIGRLGGVLTQLAAVGAIPEVEGLRDEDQGFGARPVTPGKGHAKPSTPALKAQMKEPGQLAAGTRPSPMPAGQSISMTMPAVATKSDKALTSFEMDSALVALRKEIIEKVTAITARAITSAETTNNLAQSVVEKMDVAVNLNDRVSKLRTLVGDYADQLAGFDAGLTTQMQSFGEQITQIRGDLTAGLKLLESANNNAETAAMMELTERYEELVVGLDNTLLTHQALSAYQDQLNLDFRSLLESVEMLREQKADRDEVIDGLRDKADNSRLAGLLHEDDFNEARAELDERLLACYDKFRKQDAAWMAVMKDLTAVVQLKADHADLMRSRDEATRQLQEVDMKVKHLALALGEPKAAVLTRELAKGAQCAACMVPALMELQDISSGKPFRLPGALSHRKPEQPVVPEEPCMPEWTLPKQPDLRTHTCHRWVGGSHTLLTAATRGPCEAPDLPPVAVRKFLGQGDDGRIYMMETGLQPCEECNIHPHCSEGGPCKWPF